MFCHNFDFVRPFKVEQYMPQVIESWLEKILIQFKYRADLVIIENTKRWHVHNIVAVVMSSFGVRIV